MGICFCLRKYQYEKSDSNLSSYMTVFILFVQEPSERKLTFSATDGQSTVSLLLRYSSPSQHHHMRKYTLRIGNKLRPHFQIVRIPALALPAVV